MKKTVNDSEKNMVLLLRKIIFLVPVLATMHTVAQGKHKNELRFDSLFITQSDKWPAKRVGTKKVFFGPYKIVSADKERPFKTSHSRSNDALLWFHSEVKKDHPLSLVILYNKEDSIIVNMVYSVTSISNGRSRFGTFLFGSKEPKESSEVDCKKMTIDLPGDSLSWRFIPSLDDQSFGSPGISLLGKLVRGTDTMSINRIEGARNSGLSFEISVNRLAAVQFYNTYVWIRNELDQKTKMLLGSFIAAYLSMRDYYMGDNIK